MPTDSDTATPIRLGPATVRPEWIDYNGHMNIAYYVAAFDAALEEFYNGIGFDAAYRESTGNSSMTLELHINYLREIFEGEQYMMDVLVLGTDTKRTHYFCTMRRAETDDVCATFEAMIIHVSLTARRSSPMPDWLREKFEALARDHAGIARPSQVGRSIGAPLKPGHKS
ncbi:MAG: thioesterase family protein [Rhodospirillales bacterium]